MYGLYTPIFLLQAICVYHAYRNNAEQRWYWLILLFPLIGCLIYLLYNFNNRSTLQAITENVKVAVISNYRIEQFEKALRFSDNVRNKVNLADAYVEVGRNQDAIPLYVDCLQGFMADDLAIRMKLLRAYFLNGAYNEAIELGRDLDSDKMFRDSEERVAYAWALFFAGRVDEAEKVFGDMDRSFTNYDQRLEYCKFLLKIEKSESARDKLKDLMEEFDQMQVVERRLKRDVLREVKDLYTTHFSAA